MATILVVDDEPDLVEILRFRLEREGYRVLSAEDGPSGLEAVMRHMPDLVVLDVMMPGFDGFELLRRMKADARLAQIPVILLTAKADLSSVIKGWNMDVDNFVTKPFDLDELAEMIENTLYYRSKRDAAAAEAALAA